MILLINPKTTKPSEIQTEYFREPNLGILYLAAVLDEHDYPVDILDLEQYYNLNNEELTQYLFKAVKKYDIIGITSLTNNFDFVIKIAQLIKALYKHKYIILGGPHVSFLYQEILNQFPFIDFICVGEAEDSFLELITILSGHTNHLINKKEIENVLTQIKGIAFNNSNNEIIFTGDSKPVDVEHIPLPARFLLTAPNFHYRVANIIINRGCPYQCSFCSRQNLFKNVRIRSVESIQTEIRDVIAFQSYHYINFYDNININRNFFEQFCKMFVENKFRIPWGCELRVDTITPKDANLLKKAGCRLIATGIESSNIEILQKNLKFQNPNKVREGINHLKEVGIPVQLYFVLGLPGETQITIKENLEFIKSLPLTKDDTINYFAATPYPGSRLWEEQDSYKIKIIELDFSKYDCRHIIFETGYLNFNLLKELYISAIEIENHFK